MHILMHDPAAETGQCGEKQGHPEYRITLARQLMLLSDPGTLPGEAG